MRISNGKKISVVIPAFNEAANLPRLLEKLTASLAEAGYNFEIIVVNDGSSDLTVTVMDEFHDLDDRIHYINLSRNFGHQNALKAGLDHADGDCVIMMDSDMQHPPELLPHFISKWEEGYEIVYTRRKFSADSGLFKNSTSNLFYSIVNSLSDTKLEPGTADFRLIDRKVADALKQFREIDPFLRGIVKWLGFKQYAIDYMPENRYAGKSKYSIKKMIKLAVQGATSFSIRPLYTAIYLGFTLSGISVLYFPYVMYSYFNGHAIAGWSSLIMTIVFLGGIQLIILGIIGIYVGKVFLQTKLRPNYIVQHTSLKSKVHDTVEF
ncbi:glycosyltransferase [Pedobacter sp. HMF7647]|uniref:Glycosyltransferase n=1 Tax=Hufsiella arboris TaxID=2695275 RepID=A0A7K1YBX6_9SPHI|nr:glycosyltransferase family 2 protein [Hufsiella arboris]MXV51589.1 glycosyltransferase [Hufsiella arboris]